MSIGSFQFLAFSLVVVGLYNLGRSRRWRNSILLTASLCFIASFSTSPKALLPFVAFLAVGFAGVRLAQRKSSRRAFLILLGAIILLFVWLKKYAFLPTATFLTYPYFMLGLSYIFFRVLHLIIDVHQRSLQEPLDMVDYVNYTLNFTTLVSGPIQLYPDYAATQLAPDPPALTPEVVGKALERIVIGFFKVNILALLFFDEQQRTISTLSPSQSVLVSMLSGAAIAASYTIYVYLNFSGYMDIVIGIGYFLRMELPENFDRPFSSLNFMELWNRWHMTLSSWLKTYVYNPLLRSTMQRFQSPAVEPFLGVFAFFVTFFLIGLWHGQTSEFVFYGVLLGLGVSLNKLYQVILVKYWGRKKYRALAANRFYQACARGLTFTFFSFTLLWFWSTWQQLSAFAHAMQGTALVGTWIVLFVGATLLLALYERVRDRALAVEWNRVPVLRSGYFRTVWSAGVATMSLLGIAVLNAPAPDIVYKNF